MFYVGTLKSPDNGGVVDAGSVRPFLGKTRYVVVDVPERKWKIKRLDSNLYHNRIGLKDMLLVNLTRM